MTTLSCSVVILLACTHTHKHTQLAHRPSVCLQIQWDKERLLKPQPNALYCVQLHLVSAPGSSSPLRPLCPPSICLCVSCTHTHPRAPLERFNAIRKYWDSGTFLVCSLCTSAQLIQDEAMTTSLMDMERMSLQ